MSKKFLNDPRAFSLIEVLMAISLFTFLVVGVLTMTTMGIKTNSYAQHHTKAVQLAESGLELLRRVDYATQLAAFDGVVNDYGTIPQYLEYRRSFQVTYAADISVLQVTVTWRTQRTVSFPIVLTTQRAAL
ncbi:MAG: prepilin-type N-terminal cleavage/methylation domain-containing protein [Candidatus Aminicenantes bacterium]|nr:prepilin-type N-terminal cleavage/methylation domain-containing protein [Candidatus Aminicenantes bacterium]